MVSVTRLYKMEDVEARLAYYSIHVVIIVLQELSSEL